MKNYATMIGSTCNVVSAKSKKAAAEKLGVKVSQVYIY